MYTTRAPIHFSEICHYNHRQRALVKRVMNLPVPSNVGKFLSSCTTGGFSRRAQLHEVS
jgi:hypothetical protein